MAIRNGTSGNNTLTGTAAVDTIDGKAGNDSLIGLAAVDTLIGGTGNDRLDGGTSADRMTGGTGNDTYIVDSGSDKVIESAGGGTDTVQSSASFTLAGNVERLTLTGVALRGTGNTLSNIITGNASANTLQGSSGNDTLNGGDGNDSLDGGTGADRMLGGRQDDTYIVDSAGDRAIESANQGTDTVRSAITLTLGSNVENLVLTGSAALNGIGNTLNNVITGNTGKNTLAGSSGNDTLNGGAGADSLKGGTGNDTYILDNTGDRVNESGGGGVDTVRSAFTFTLATGFEHLVLTGTKAINGVGNTASNSIVGNTGINTLVGNNGNDSLVGGSGNDRLDGGTGNDRLDGGAGNDSMIGGSGNDTYVVNSTGDKINEAANAGTDTVQSSITFTLPTTNSNALENLTLTGTAAINGTGNNAANTIAGNSGANTLSGGNNNDALFGNDGNDRLNGGAGNDLLEGGNGNDIFSGGSGNDSFVGGAGTDTAAYAGRLDDFTVSGNATNATVTDDVGTNGTDTLNGVDRIRFTDLGLDLSTATPTAFQELGAMAAGAGFRLDGVDSNDLAGFSVAVLGDINGDGFDDIAVGAPGAARGVLANAGEVYVVFGKAVGFTDVDLGALNGTDGFKLSGVGSADTTGKSVAALGDVNGDGFDDFIVGAYGANSGSNVGRSYVVFGKDGGFAPTLDLASLGSQGSIFNGVDPGDRSGVSVASAGDVNGDGLDDIIIGAYIAGNAAGEAYVVFNQGALGTSFNLSTLDGTNGFKLNGINPAVVNGHGGDFLGISVASAGDINGDGFADIIVGANAADVGALDAAGQAHVVFGDAGGFPASIDLDDLNGTNGFSLRGVAAGDLTGFSVSSAGDMNGDGLDDLLVSAIIADTPGGTNAGSAFVVFGDAAIGAGGTFELANLDGTNGFRINGVSADAQTGVSVWRAGDVNGDGFDDIIVGANQVNPRSVFEAGVAYVIFGESNVGTGGLIDPNSLGADEGFRIEGIDAGDLAGSAVGGGGDVNGDGFDDVVVGAPFADPDGRSAAGEAYVLFGGDFAGLVTHQGTANDDPLVTADIGDNILVGGLGNDMLDGGAGNDVMVGGAGNDVLVFEAGDTLRVDGGNGFDTLRVGGTDNLDLTAINATANYHVFTGIEGIDLTAGAGASTLTLDARDLLHLSDTSNALRVDGDADDAVVATGTWVNEGSAAGYTTFTQGEATLQVADAINQAGIQT